MRQSSLTRAIPERAPVATIPEGGRLEEAQVTRCCGLIHVYLTYIYVYIYMYIHIYLYIHIQLQISSEILETHKRACTICSKIFK